MKKVLYLTVLAFTLAIPAATAQSGEEKAVAAAVEQLRKAMVDADKTALDAVAARELSYGHSAGKVEDKAAFIEAIVSGKSDFTSIALSDQTITVSGDVALVRHALNGETNDGGKTGTVALGVLLVWQKQSGHWKLIARQAFKRPTP